MAHKLYSKWINIITYDAVGDQLFSLFFRISYQSGSKVTRKRPRLFTVVDRELIQQLLVSTCRLSGWGALRKLLCLTGAPSLRSQTEEEQEVSCWRCGGENP